MTEQEWLTCDMPYAMFEFLTGTATERRLRLLACACCRLIPEFMESLPDRQALELTERDVDGSGDDETLYRIEEQWDVRWYRKDGWDAVWRATECYFEAAGKRDGGQARNQLEWLLASVDRDIFGNPFRTVTAAPAWLTSTVISLAQGIYAERAFDRMPILADALQDAGCENAAVLGHCRGPGPHVRGCWVVDLLLGKA